MSAIARVLFERGETVTGSDLTMSEFAESLAEVGVPVTIGHAAAAVSGADLVLASSAIPADNVELLSAAEAGIPVLTRAAFLPELIADYRSIAVAGTHGKTTTSAMIAWILSRAGLDPSFIVGGMPIDLGTNSRQGTGDYFVIEADEYDRTFLGLYPTIAVITNVEHDHPDDYPSFEDFETAFKAFVSGVQEQLIVNADDPKSEGLDGQNLSRVTFGLREGADWRAEDLRQNDAGGLDFLAVKDKELTELIRLRVPGEHNVRNALGALAAVHEVGVEFSAARSALAEFHGVGRRFEIVGERAGITVIDDYAHHPSEIEATLQAARHLYPEAQIWAVYQPHTFSRTKVFFDRLTRSFGAADHVIVTEIFAAREEPDPEVSAAELAAGIEGQDVRFIPSLEEVANQVVQDVEPGAVVITLSAGDANQVGLQVLRALTPHSKGESHA